VRTRAERLLDFEQTLVALLGLIGTEVEITITPTVGGWTTMVVSMSGVLRKGERRRLTLGAVADEEEDESVFFSLNQTGTAGFAVGRRVFGGARVERHAAGTTVRIIVGPNDVVVSPASGREPPQESSP
jgi:hypothetical protein